MMKTILFSAVVALTGYYAQAQCGDWKFPEDKATFDEKNVLYSDALRNKDYANAKGPHLWILTNAPDVNKAIYINGEKIYKGLADKEKDADKKKEYIDSLMLMYDMRLQYTPCGEEADIAARKAYNAYRYNVKNKSELENILGLFDKAYELNGKDLPYYMILPYMSVVQYNVKYVKNLSEDQILDRYDKVIETVDYQIANGKKPDRIKKLKDYKGSIEGILVGLVDINCDFVREKMAPKFRENPEDLKMAKKIFGFMLKGKCTDDPLWLETGEVILANTPDFAIAKALGSKFKAAKETEKAEKYFNQALEIASEPADKADMYIQLGNLKSGSVARDYYRKALSADPSKKEAYSAIGYLYYGSFERCAGKEDWVKDRAIFIAAYDMFKRGGNTAMMGKAKDAFPSKEEVFTYNYEVGTSVTVGCWVNETVTIQTRD
ncbi:hypothetical protein FNH22_04555 [Fulvivirga sp. M361]|uniref:tetratricopeptide repeat protein n=1 Tax=Fulvivirga sp. M361 TaxID=2594266 RepID=UPI001179D9F2|nr:hypothetical protein [Fulvivirga sp. M361]TRX61332.1 hypothetical protein FNH22_04555 [Fulvivirga sp. M361]